MTTATNAKSIPNQNKLKQISAWYANTWINADYLFCRCKEPEREREQPVALYTFNTYID